MIIEIYTPMNTKHVVEADKEDKHRILDLIFSAEYGDIDIKTPSGRLIIPHEVKRRCIFMVKDQHSTA